MGDLRYFVQAFVTTQLLSAEADPEVTGSTKPKVQVGQLRELDLLTVQVTKAITTATAVEGLQDKTYFVPKDVVCASCDLRKKWFEFTKLCWEYVLNLCIVLPQQAPQEFHVVKERLDNLKQH